MYSLAYTTLRGHEVAHVLE